MTNSKVHVKTSLSDYKNYESYAQEAVRDIASRIGKQGQFLNWINVLIENQIKNLDNIYKMANKARENGDDELAVIGIGGSRHTTEAMVNMLGVEDKVHLYSALDPKSFERFSKKIDVSKTKFLIVSKSGGTMETTKGYEYAKALVQKVTGKIDVSEKFIAMTDANPEKSKLRRAVNNGEFLESGFVHDDVGGRFSIFDDATLFTLAFVGVKKEDVLRMLNSSLEAQKDFLDLNIEKNDALRLAIFNVDSANKGRTNHGVEYFGDAFFGATLWEKQMKNESLKSSITTDTNIGPAYLHYNAEADLDPNNKKSFYTFINYKTDDPTMIADLRGVKSAYSKSHPISEIELEDLSFDAVGRFIELKHFETLYTGNILRRTNGNITQNSVALPEVLQPNVEIYKEEVRQAMA